MRLTDCTSTLVGISKNNCPDCFLDPANESFNVIASDSGQYLDELIDMRALKSSDCSDEIWKVCDSAITQAKIDVESELQVEVGKQGSKIRKTWNGYVGKATYSLKNISFTDMRGIYIQPKVYGSELVIDKISVWSDTTGTETAYLLRSDTDGYISTFDLNTTANVWQENTLSTPLTLSKTRSDDTDLAFYIVRATSAMTVNNDDCGCGGAEWQNWAVIGEGRATDVDDMDTFSNHGSFNNKSGRANGLRLNISSKCDMELCANLNDPGFSNVIARAIILKAAIAIKSDPKLNNRITPDSLLNGEEEQIQLNNWVGEYKEEKLPLLAMLHSTQGDCMVCDESRVKKTSLL